MENTDILELLRQGRQEGLNGLLDRYGGLMNYIIRGILADPREQEECLSDVCMKLWREAERFNLEKGGFATWLTAITRNAALNRLKAVQRRESRQTDWEEAAACPTESPEETLLRQERAQALHRALEKLSVREQTLFYRKYYYLQSTAQIAAELGMSERAVEGRLYRLRGKLRQWLGGEEHG